MTTHTRIPIPAWAFIDPCPGCGKPVAIEGHSGAYSAGAPLCNDCATATAELARTVADLARTVAQLTKQVQQQQAELDELAELAEAAVAR